MADDIDLIAAIYDTIIDPSGWEAAIKRIVAATNSTSGALIVHKTDAVHFTALCNVDPFYATGYVETYSKISPLAAEAGTIAPGEVRAGTRITQTDAFRASAFYNEFARPQGWVDVVRIGLLRAPGAVGRLVLHRSHKAIWVEPAQWQLLESIAPHLWRAAAVHELITRAKAGMNAIGAADEAAGFAVFLLTKDCHVLFANSKAEDLLRREMGLRYTCGQLAGTTSGTTMRLQALVRAAARPGSGEGVTGDTLELNRGENSPPLLAHVIPVAANRTAEIFDIDKPAVAIFVVDPLAEFGAQIRRFASKFGLTPGETRVLKEILGGNGLPAAAARLKITPATARTHAYRILGKTETSRQAELIRRFFESSVPAHAVANADGARRHLFV
jgi:DNA-binding CsgD family transcriptional regulator